MTKEIVKTSQRFIRPRKNKIVRMSILCYKNSLRLHQDSIYLYKKRRYPSANALSIIALEEMGKYISLAHGLHYDHFNSEQEEDLISQTLKQTYDHRIKQRVFMNFGWHEVFSADIKKLDEKNIDFSTVFNKLSPHFDEPNFDSLEFEKYFPNLRRFYKRMYALDTSKLDSFYVGFPKKKGGDADFEKRLRPPFSIGRKKSRSPNHCLKRLYSYRSIASIKGSVRVL